LDLWLVHKSVRQIAHRLKQGQLRIESSRRVSGFRENVALPVVGLDLGLDDKQRLLMLKFGLSRFSKAPT
jgi:UDP-N-acetyl-D-mannosaminuronate dehydrogenase